MDAKFTPDVCVYEVQFMVPAVRFPPIQINAVQVIDVTAFSPVVCVYVLCDTIPVPVIVIPEDMLAFIGDANVVKFELSVALTVPDIVTTPVNVQVGKVENVAG